MLREILRQTGISAEEVGISGTPFAESKRIAKPPPGFWKAPR